MHALVPVGAEPTGSVGAKQATGPVQELAIHTPVCGSCVNPASHPLLTVVVHGPHCPDGKHACVPRAFKVWHAIVCPAVQVLLHTSGEVLDATAGGKQSAGVCAETQKVSVGSGTKPILQTSKVQLPHVFWAEQVS